MNTQEFETISSLNDPMDKDEHIVSRPGTCHSFAEQRTYSARGISTERCQTLKLETTKYSRGKAPDYSTVGAQIVAIPLLSPDHRRAYIAALSRKN